MPLRPRLFAPKAELLAEAERARLLTLLNASNSVSCIVDAGGTVRGITPNGGRILGDLADKAVELQLTVGSLLQAEVPEQLQSHLDNLTCTEPGEPRTWRLASRSPTGVTRWLEVTGTNFLFDAQISGLYLEIRDITEGSEQSGGTKRAPAASSAFYDSITGAPTFELLRERSRPLLALARRHGHTAALLHVDMKGLKSVNQSLGVALGDELLRKFAERLKQGLRESDTIARLGDDEFLILLSDVAEADATARVVRRLRESVSRPFKIRDHTLSVGSSFGVALYPQDATTFDEMLEYATLAMKRAQLTGSGYEFYRQELTELTLERMSLEDDLRWAWERKQFLLHYQPVIALSSNQMIGAEALARAHMMEISPAQFIPMAERSGRIVALDRWALATAIRQAVTWTQSGWNGWVSVNLSARSLHDADLPSYIQRCFDQHGLEPRRLVLEVTETAAMRDTDMTARILRELKQTGALIALDDFGVGHSSLAYLKHFPVDVLKLDHSFVHGIGNERKHEHLIETMISFAHRIGAQVVAEGVEHGSQLEWLRQAACDFVQGYLVGRPQPPEIILNTVNA